MAIHPRGDRIDKKSPRENVGRSETQLSCTTKTAPRAWDLSRNKTRIDEENVCVLVISLDRRESHPRAGAFSVNVSLPILVKSSAPLNTNIYATALCKLESCSPESYLYIFLRRAHALCGRDSLSSLDRNHRSGPSTGSIDPFLFPLLIETLTSQVRLVEKDHRWKEILAIAAGCFRGPK